MIGVYAICEVKTDKTAEFETIMQSLVAASHQDKGCVSYDCGKVADKEATYTFIERWETQADLELHTKQPHFTQAVEAFNTVLAKDIEINVVELM